ncbi:MAG: helix-turn-helix domain-containing protein [Muribaculaceae bacterium]|nr:helix-turn-helix domain-containing protein [Muribaculaceae bacterium]
MQDEVKILYKTIGELLKDERVRKNLGYTLFCYENDIPKSTYDEILKGKKQTSLYNIFKIIRALGLNFEDFGKKLDAALPPEIWDLDE